MAWTDEQKEWLANVDPQAKNLLDALEKRIAALEAGGVGSRPPIFPDSMEDHYTIEGESVDVIYDRRQS